MPEKCHGRYLAQLNTINYGHDQKENQKIYANFQQKTSKNDFTSYDPHRGIYLDIYCMTLYLT